MRSVGNSVAMITNWLFVYVVVIMTPNGKVLLCVDETRTYICKAIANIQWRFYIIFAVLNFAWFPIVWFFYIETKGLSLEEIDLMFKIKYHGGKDMTYKKAAVVAKQEANVVRSQAISEKNKSEIQMVECVI